MPSMQDSKNDPHDVLEIAPDVVLVARAAAEFPSLAPDAAYRPGERQPNMGLGSAAEPVTPTVDTSFRATDTSGGRAHGGWVQKVLVTFIFASCSALAVAAWEHYGDDAQEMVAGITPQIMPTLRSWLPTQNPATATQADTAEPAAVRQPTPPPAPPAAQPQDNTTATAAAPPVTPATTDQLQQLQSVARDVASLTHEIDELKATVAQLKASQEQLSREKARPPEPRTSEARPVEPRPTKLGAPPRPLGTLVQRTRPPVTPPQAAYVPAPPSAAPVQIAPPPAASQPEGDPVVRPPMPVR